MSKSIKLVTQRGQIDSKIRQEARNFLFTKNENNKKSYTELYGVEFKLPSTDALKVGVPYTSPVFRELINCYSGTLEFDLSLKSGHESADAWRRVFFAECIKRAPTGPKTVIINPSMVEVHLFAGSTFIYTAGTDPYDSNRVSKPCGCGDECVVLQHARLDDRLFVTEEISAVAHRIRGKVTTLILTFIEPHLTGNSLANFCRKAEIAFGFSIFNADPRDLTRRSYKDDSCAQQNDFADGFKISRFQGGGSYLLDEDKINSIFKPAFSQDGAPLRRSVMFSSFSTHAVSFELGEAGISPSVAFRPAFEKYYFLELLNFKKERELILVKRKQFNKVFGQVKGLQLINYNNVMLVLRQNKLTYTLNGAALEEKLDNDADELDALAVFLVVYALSQQKIAEARLKTMGVVKKNITKAVNALEKRAIEEAEDYLEIDLSAAGEFDSVKQALLSKMYLSLGLTNSLGTQKSIVTTYIDAIYSSGEIQTLDQISTKNYERHVGTNTRRNNSWTAHVASHFSGDLLRKNLDARSFAKKTLSEYLSILFDKFLTSYDVGARLLIKICKIADLSTTVTIDLLIFTARFIGLNRVVPNLLILKNSLDGKTEAVNKMIRTIRDAYNYRPLEALIVVLESLIVFRQEVTAYEELIDITKLQAVRWRGILTELKNTVVSIRNVSARSGAAEKAYDALVQTFELNKKEAEELKTEVKKWVVEKKESTNKTLSCTLPEVDFLPLNTNNGVKILSEISKGDEIYLNGTVIHYKGIEEADSELSEELKRSLKNNTKDKTHNFVSGPKCLEQIVPILSKKTGTELPEITDDDVEILKTNLESSSLTRHLVDCVEEVRKLQGKLLMTVRGLPMSGKSKFIRGNLRSEDLIVVPTNKLKKEWKAAFADNLSKMPTVMTMFEALKVGCSGRVIIDEFYSIDKTLGKFLLRLAPQAITIGDENQQPPYKSEHLKVRGEYNFYSKSSFVPLDALLLFCEGLALDAVICCSDIKRSLKVTSDSEIVDGIDLAIGCSNDGVNLLKFNNYPAVTGMSSQGSRSEKTLIILNDKEVASYKESRRTFAVAITRSRTENIIQGSGYLSQLSNLVDKHGVNGLNVCEFLGDSNLSIEFVQSLEQTPNLRQADLLEYFNYQPICMEHVNGTPVTVGEKVEADTILPIHPNSISITYPDPECTNVSEDLGVRGNTKPEHTILEMNLRGLKGGKLESREYLGKKEDRMLQRFKTVVDFKKMKKYFSIIEQASGLSSKKPEQCIQFLQEDLKTDLKSTLSQSLNKGSRAKKTTDILNKPPKIQGVTANSKSIQIFFAATMKALTISFALALRPGVNVDVLLTDEQLNECLCKINSKLGRKLEIDLTKQDSTHTTPHVLMFARILHEMEVREEIINLFLDIRSGERTFVLSFNSSFNLSLAMSSGAPWTLIANILMMFTSVLNKYDLSGINFLQKGDDLSMDGIPMLVEPIYELSVIYEEKIVSFVQFTSKVNLGPILLRKYVKTLVGAIYDKFTYEQAEGLHQTLKIFFEEVNHIGFDNYAEAVAIHFQFEPGFYLELLYNAYYVFKNRKYKIITARARELRIINKESRCVFNSLLPFMKTNEDKVKLYENLNFDNVSTSDIMLFLRENNYDLKIKVFGSTYEQRFIKQLFYDEYYDIYLFNDHMMSKTYLDYDYIDLFKKTMK